jgi:hypothetical protein
MLAHVRVRLTWVGRRKWLGRFSGRAGWVRPAVLSAPVECARTGGLIGWEPFWWKPTKLSERIYQVRAEDLCRRKETLPAIASRLRMYGLDRVLPTDSNLVN